MKRFFLFILVLILLLALAPGCGKGPAQPGSAHKAPAIRPLSVYREAAALTAVEDAVPWERYWAEPDTVNADLSAYPGLAYSLIVGDNTTFNGPLPRGYDPEALLEWGKDPGLNVDILHAHGFTGKGAVIAYIDQPVAPHEEYDRETVHIENPPELDNSFHGPAVLSLLAGETIGVAPEAEVYYVSAISGDGASQLHEADALYRVIAINETLPEGEKITMVGFSDNISSGEPYEEEFRRAAQACKDAGIMVWFCGENGAVTFLPYADKNDPDNLVLDQWGGGLPSLAYVPSSGRTVAATLRDTNYIYFPTGGLSWTMPYTLGLYAIAVSIDPSLDQEALRTLIRSTAYIGTRKTLPGDALSRTEEIRIVNPVGFVAAVLEGAGRNEEARALREEAAARQKYLYAVVNLKTMSSGDLGAVYTCLAWYTEAKVLVADASRFESPEELYAAIRQDASDRGGEIAGIQVFGDETAVPPLPGEGGKDGTPVLRLALEPGGYTSFFREYRASVLRGDLEGPESCADALFTPNYAAMAISLAEGELG